MAQLTELIEVCQTCLQCSCEEAEFHKLNNSDPELEDVRLRDKLYFCVPELKDVLKDGDEEAICHFCFEALLTAYSFRNLCMETKSKLETQFLYYCHPKSSSTELDIKEEIIDENFDGDSTLNILKDEPQDASCVVPGELKTESPFESDEESCHYPVVEVDDSLLEQSREETQQERERRIIENACSSIPLLVQKKITPNHFNCRLQIKLLSQDELNSFLANSEEEQRNSLVRKLKCTKTKCVCRFFRKCDIHKNKYTRGQRLKEKIEKPFGCTVCENKFITQSHLNAHAETHFKKNDLENLTVSEDVFENAVSSMLYEIPTPRRKKRILRQRKSARLNEKNKRGVTTVDRYYIRLVTAKFRKLSIRSGKKKMAEMPRLVPEAKTPRERTKNTSMPVLVPVVASVEPRDKSQLVQKPILKETQSSLSIEVSKVEPHFVHDDFGLIAPLSFPSLVDATENVSGNVFIPDTDLNTGMTEYIISQLKKSCPQQNQIASRPKRRSSRLETAEAFEDDGVNVDTAIESAVNSVISFLETSEGHETASNMSGFRKAHSSSSEIENEPKTSKAIIASHNENDDESRLKTTKNKQKNKSDDSAALHDHTYFMQCSKKPKMQCQYCGAVIECRFLLNQHMDNYHATCYFSETMFIKDHEKSKGRKVYKPRHRMSAKGISFLSNLKNSSKEMVASDKNIEQSLECNKEEPATDKIIESDKPPQCKPPTLSKVLLQNASVAAQVTTNEESKCQNNVQSDLDENALVEDATSNHAGTELRDLSEKHNISDEKLKEAQNQISTTTEVLSYSHTMPSEKKLEQHTQNKLLTEMIERQQPSEASEKLCPKVERMLDKILKRRLHRNVIPQPELPVPQNKILVNHADTNTVFVQGSTQENAQRPKFSQTTNTSVAVPQVTRENVEAVPPENTQTNTLTLFLRHVEALSQISSEKILQIANVAKNADEPLLRHTPSQNVKKEAALVAVPDASLPPSVLPPLHEVHGFAHEILISKSRGSTEGPVLYKTQKSVDQNTADSQSKILLQSISKLSEVTCTLVKVDNQTVPTQSSGNCQMLAISPPRNVQRNSHVQPVSEPPTKQEPRIPKKPPKQSRQTKETSCKTNLKIEDKSRLPSLTDDTDNHLESAVLSETSYDGTNAPTKNQSNKREPNRKVFDDNDAALSIDKDSMNAIGSPFSRVAEDEATNRSSSPIMTDSDIQSSIQNQPCEGNCDNVVTSQSSGHVCENTASAARTYSEQPLNIDLSTSTQNHSETYYVVIFDSEEQSVSSKQTDSPSESSGQKELVNKVGTEQTSTQKSVGNIEISSESPDNSINLPKIVRRGRGRPKGSKKKYHDNDARLSIDNDTINAIGSPFSRVAEDEATNRFSSPITIDSDTHSSIQNQPVEDNCDVVTSQSSGHVCENTASAARTYSEQPLNIDLSTSTENHSETYYVVIFDSEEQSVSLKQTDSPSESSGQKELVNKVGTEQTSTQNSVRNIEISSGSPDNSLNLPKIVRRGRGRPKGSKKKYHGNDARLSTDNDTMNAIGSPFSSVAEDEATNTLSSPIMIDSDTQSSIQNQPCEGNCDNVVTSQSSGHICDNTASAARTYSDQPLNTDLSTSTHNHSETDYVVISDSEEQPVSSKQTDSPTEPSAQKELVNKVDTEQTPTQNSVGNVEISSESPDNCIDLPNIVRGRGRPKGLKNKYHPTCEIETVSKRGRPIKMRAEVPREILFGEKETDEINTVDQKPVERTERPPDANSSIDTSVEVVDQKETEQDNYTDEESDSAESFELRLQLSDSDENGEETQPSKDSTLTDVSLNAKEETGSEIKEQEQSTRNCETPISEERCRINAQNELHCGNYHTITTKEPTVSSSTVCESLYNKILFKNEIATITCPLCGKCFAEDNYERTHSCVCSGNPVTDLTLKTEGATEESQNHGCEVCEKSFKDLIGLKCHGLIHSYEKQSGSKTMKDLKHKIEGIKDSIKHLKTFRCVMCDMSFISNAQLKMHCAFKHGMASDDRNVSASELNKSTQEMFLKSRSAITNPSDEENIETLVSVPTKQLKRNECLRLTYEAEVCFQSLGTEDLDSLVRSDVPTSPLNAMHQTGATCAVNEDQYSDHKECVELKQQLSDDHKDVKTENDNRSYVDVHDENTIAVISDVEQECDSAEISELNLQLPDDPEGLDKTQTAKNLDVHEDNSKPEKRLSKDASAKLLTHSQEITKKKRRRRGFQFTRRKGKRKNKSEQCLSTIHKNTSR